MDQKQWKRQRDLWRSRLEKWHSPQDFRNSLDELRTEYGRQLLFKAGFTSLFRETYVASAFAFYRSAEKVRLIQAERPDFEIEVLGRKQMYEVVEADTPGRRRGDEVKHQPKLPTGAPLSENFYLTRELAPQILEKAAKRKDMNVYQPEWGLVIVLNPAQPGGQEQQDIEEGMVRATTVATNRFKEIWVLWERTFYNPWHREVPENSILHPPDTRQNGADFIPALLSPSP